VSATNRSGARQEGDFYKTPKWAIEAVWPEVYSFLNEKALVWTAKNGGEALWCLDPCAGDGSLLQAVVELAGKSEVPVQCSGIEIDRGRWEACEKLFPCFHANCLNLGDAAPSWGSENRKPHLIFTNPPFGQALPILQRAIAEVHPDGLVAFLLRLAFLESEERASFHDENPSDVHVLRRRPEFVQSIKCKGKKPSPATHHPGLNPGPVACGWSVVLPIEAETPRVCSNCGGPVSVTRSDSSAYAWFLYGKDIGGKWTILPGKPKAA